MGMSGRVTIESDGAPSSGDSIVEAVSAVIIDCIVEFNEMPRAEISRSSLLENLDIDSLDLVEITQVLEERFGIVIEQTHVKDVATVGDAIDAVVALIPK
ncbi:MAG TPA: acyl carrier protein [Solirubrobacteraceae bacterium]|jgi:acyl carrier protein|nr:acyl carrier protein [Solirubrobacteraceae bacterium]